jgi:FdhD protein
MMVDTRAVVRRTIKKVLLNKMTVGEDQLAIEEPLEIALSYSGESGRVRRSVSVTMRTPGHDEALGVGFLYTEGIIRDAGQVEGVEISVLEENKVLVNLRDGEIPNLATAERNFYTTSSCGVCGKSSIDAIKTVSVYRGQSQQISAHVSVVLTLIPKLRDAQRVFSLTGGLHASALFDINGNLLLLREDVGRHNALDKLIGASFLESTLPLGKHILLLSGRASFELIQKASMAGIKIVAAIGAPSSLAVQLAEESDMTLIGFLKESTFNIYSGSERISGL